MPELAETNYELDKTQSEIVDLQKQLLDKYLLEEKLKQRILTLKKYIA